MKTIITAKLKLHTTPDQFTALRATQLAYRDSLNLVSRYAFAQGKISNAVRLQDGTYDDIRARFHLPSQMACSVPRTPVKQATRRNVTRVWINHRSTFLPP